MIAQPEKDGFPAGVFVRAREARVLSRAIGRAGVPVTEEGSDVLVRFLRCVDELREPDGTEALEEVRPEAPLTFDEFSERSVPLKTPDGPLLLWATGLGGESGEVAEALLDVLALVVSASRVQDAAKKIVRDEGGLNMRGVQVDQDAALLREAGDQLFYLDKVLRDRGLSLERAARALLEKLDGMREQNAPKVGDFWKSRDGDATWIPLRVEVEDVDHGNVMFYYASLIAPADSDGFACPWPIKGGTLNRVSRRTSFSVPIDQFLDHFEKF